MSLRSAQAAERGAKPKRNFRIGRTGGESVVRVFLKSAQAAARTTKSVRNSSRRVRCCEFLRGRLRIITPGSLLLHSLEGA